MGSWRPDPTFYASPSLAADAPAEQLAYVAMIAAGVQVWRPNIVAFGTGLMFALMGLVLYNTRASALAIALLVLSLARPAAK